MKALASRVARIEKAMSKRGACSCGGPYRVRLLIEGRDPDPEPCPRCGTMGKIIQLVRGEPPAGWPGGPEESGDPA